MDATQTINSDEAQNLLGKATPLNPDEVVKLLRFLKRANDDLVGKLRQLKSEVGKLQELSGREIKLLAVPEQVEDSVLHYLRADGREVRPGGRRRR